VSIDGAPAADATFSVQHPSGAVSVDVPPGAASEMTILLSVPDATTPVSLGLSPDERVVGLEVSDITFVP
jgi:hypothetical protein